MKTAQKSCACHTKRLSTRYQTGWNITKCHACHAKRHNNLLETLQKERFCSFPHRHGEATGKPETRDKTRGSIKMSISCEASTNFQHISQNATRATESAACCHLTQPCQCDSQKTRNTTRLKCCACHAK